MKELVRRGEVASENRARQLVEAGRVTVDGFPVDNPNSEVNGNAQLEIIEEKSNDWVGRGAKKIWPLLAEDKIVVKNKICLDVGASTGGFTQALLKAGAQKVYAVDVGYGQLDWSLRQDERVIVKDRYNFRYARSEDFQPSPALFAMDVSFISSLKLISALNEVMAGDSRGILLIKPQFEAPREDVKDGIIKEPSTWRRTLERVLEGWEESGWGCYDLQLSPVAGNEGNREFVALLARAAESKHEQMIDPVVDRAAG